MPRYGCIKIHVEARPGHVCGLPSGSACHFGLPYSNAAWPLWRRGLPIVPLRTAVRCCGDAIAVPPPANSGIAGWHVRMQWGSYRPLQQRSPAIMLFIYAPMTSHSNQAFASWCLPDPPPRAFLHCKTYCAGGLICNKCTSPCLLLRCFHYCPLLR